MKKLIQNVVDYQFLYEITNDLNKIIIDFIDLRKKFPSIFCWSYDQILLGW